MQSRVFKQILRDYFTLNKTERQGFAVLCILMLMALLLNYLAGRIERQNDTPFPELTTVYEPMSTQQGKDAVLSLFPFDPNIITPDELSKFNLPGNIRTNLLRYRERGGVYKKPEDVRRLYGMSDSIFNVIEPFLVFNEPVNKQQVVYSESMPKVMYLFNPNTLPDSAFLEMPLPPRIIRNLLSYRENGGRFRKKEDLKVIYGMDEATYTFLEPWIQIEAESVYATGREEVPDIDINRADSIDWIRLPGIGPVFASRILKYREQLGGFHSQSQLEEVYGMTPERVAGIREYLRVVPEDIRQVRINYAGYDALRLHPYISPAQAREIIRIRAESGPYLSVEALLSGGHFDEVQFQKLRPYLTCN